MTQLTLTDLSSNTELDLAASQEVQGGFFPMANIVAMFEMLEFTQNATSIAVINDGVGGSVLNNFNTSSLSAASPMQVLKMSSSTGE